MSLDEEIARYPVGSLVEDSYPVVEQPSITKQSRINLPTKFDLRDEIISPIKDQNNSNICWSFSSILPLESSLAWQK